MYIEIQVASNFIASLLYNRLPRRRVNIFSEELEKALREKFTGHWYPTLPEKGSGFRCIKVGRVFDPPDAVLNKAAVESGTPINEIVENLPEELTLWIDPGEVSYRIGERKPVKVLYFERASSDSKNHNSSSSSGSSDDGSGDSSGKATVLAIDAGSPTFMSDLEDTCAGPASGTSFPPFKPTTVTSVSGPDSPVLPAVVGAVATANASPVMNARLTPRFKNVKMLNNNTTGMMNFATRCQTPTFTTASFAQTKFGSTKLKTNSKRTNRMSPTEFSNYIKQRAQMQQMNQNHPLSPMMSPRPLSPQIRSFGENYFFASNGSGNAANSAAINGFRAGSTANGGSMLDMGSSGSSDSSSFGGTSTSSKYSFLDEGSSPFFNQSSTSSSLSSSLSPIGTPPASLLLNGAGGISDGGHSTSPSSSSSSATSKHSIQQDFDFLDNLNFAANSTAANSYNHPYQQLLLAN